MKTVKGKTRNILSNSKNADLRSVGSKISEDEMPYSSQFSNSKAGNSARESDVPNGGRATVMNRRSNNKVNTSLNARPSEYSKSRLIIRGGSSENMRASKRISSKNKYGSHYNKLVISIKQDLDPSSVLDKIENLDREMSMLESNIPSGLTNEEEGEIEEMIQANNDLRAKVAEVSKLVKITLTKVNDMRVNNKKREDKEVQKEPVELTKKKTELDRIHAVILSKRVKIEQLKGSILRVPVDPRSLELRETDFKLNQEIAKEQDEIRILKSQGKTQMSTLKKLNTNPGLDQRLEMTKKELADTKEKSKELEKAQKEIMINGQLKSAELIDLEEEVRKVKDKLNLLKSGHLTKELKAEKVKAKKEKVEQDKQEIFVRRLEVEDTVHKNAMKSLEINIKTAESEIKKTQDKIAKMTEQNSKLSAEVKQLREMVRNKIKKQDEGN